MLATEPVMLMTMITSQIIYDVIYLRVSWSKVFSCTKTFAVGFCPKKKFKINIHASKVFTGSKQHGRLHKELLISSSKKYFPPMVFIIGFLYIL